MSPHICLSATIHQAICVLGDMVEDGFSELGMSEPAFKDEHKKELNAAIFIGLCAKEWPDLMESFSALSNSIFSKNDIIKILVPHMNMIVRPAPISGYTDNENTGNCRENHMTLACNVVSHENSKLN